MNVIIVPYRNRESHLNIFLENGLKYFKKHLEPFKIVVVEQSSTKLFNRGKLLNIGVVEYFDEKNNYFLHDVDSIPTEFCITTNYIKHLDANTVIGLYNYGSIDTMGGVIKISGKDFKEINGFPNDIFGWGGEDKALKNRADCYGKKFIKTVHVEDRDVNVYFNILKDFHDPQRVNQQSARVHNQEYILFEKLSYHAKEEHIKKSGLNNIEYTILSKNVSEYIDHIIVDV
jgi:hypothetical protein